MISPSPEDIKKARKDAGLTQTKAAELIYFKLRTWQDWEGDKARMHASAFELFTLKTKDKKTGSSFIQFR